MSTYKTHTLAEIFPPMGDPEYKLLRTDMGVNGQREPITLFENKILDGRHRAKACEDLHLTPRVRNYTGNDPLGFIISENLRRRHLDESQRAIVAAKIVELNGFKRGGDRRSENQTANLPIEKSNSQVAKELNVSERSVRTARKVLRDAPKAEVEAIERGEKTVSAVAKKVKAAKAEKEVITDKVGRVVPDELVPEWQRAEQVGKRLRSLAFDIKHAISEGFTGVKGDKLKDHIYAEVGHITITDVEALAYTLGTIIPYALCPTCQGLNRKQCTLCRKRGWISKFMWNGPAVDEQTRKLIKGQL